MLLIDFEHGKIVSNGHFYVYIQSILLGFPPMCTHRDWAYFVWNLAQQWYHGVNMTPSSFAVII